MSPNRKVIDTFGRKRKRGYVKVFREDVGDNSLVRVQWMQPASATTPARLRTESFDDTRKGIAEAKAFAEGVHSELAHTKKVEAPMAPITVRELHQAYKTAKETEWSPNTLRLSNERWGKFELFVGKDKIAQDVKRERLDELKKALLERHAPNQVKHVLKEVVRVYTWGVERDLVPPTKITNYAVKFRRSSVAAGPKMAEYSFEERAQLSAVLDPRKPTEWRPWVANTLLAFSGPRIDAALKLEIGDVELAVEWLRESDGWRPVFSGMIHWRPENDKMGTERLQPMPEPVAEAFWVALGWRQFDQYSGRFLFYGFQRRTRGQALRHDTRRSINKSSIEGVVVDEKPWTYSAFNGWLHRAEKRAGIEHIKYRAAHGSRRGIAGDIHDETGSEKTAAEWIGDRSIRVVRDRYLLERADRQKKTAHMVGRNRNEAQQPTKKGSETSSEPSQPSVKVEPAVGIEPTTARLHKGREWPKD